MMWPLKCVCGRHSKPLFSLCLCQDDSQQTGCSGHGCTVYIAPQCPEDFTDRVSSLAASHHPGHCDPGLLPPTLKSQSAISTNIDGRREEAGWRGGNTPRLRQSFMCLGIPRLKKAFMCFGVLCKPCVQALLPPRDPSSSALEVLPHPRQPFLRAVRNCIATQSDGCYSPHHGRN